jgi:hypothetical protein
MPVTPQVPGQGDPDYFNCLIEGEYKLFQVTLEQNLAVGHLKKAIQSEATHGILKDVDPYSLELWRVSA